MSYEQLKGTGVALVTPFTSDLSVDYPGLERVLDHVVNGNVDYLVVMGSTGEAATISWEEQIEVLEYIIKQNKKNLPIVFGLGGNNTLHMAHQLKSLKDYPITAILSASPHYNKPTQKGIVAHFEYLAERSPFPIILYNVPSRTCSNMTAETTIKLSSHQNIIGIKEASGDLNQCNKIIANVDPSFMVISGDDALTFSMIVSGGHGVISVIANLLPGKFCTMVKATMQGKLDEARKLNMQLIPVYDLLSVEGNPVSLKAGMKVLGIMDDNVRLPLVKASDKLGESFQQWI